MLKKTWTRFCSHLFQRFKARIDAEKHRELVSLALQRNVSLKSRRAKLQSFLQWVASTQKGHQRETRTINEYIGLCPSVRANGDLINDSAQKYQGRNGNKKEYHMPTFERPKLTTEHLALRNMDEGKPISSEPDRSNEICRAKQSLETDFITRVQQLTDAEQQIEKNTKQMGKHEELKIDSVDKNMLKSAVDLGHINIVDVGHLNIAKQNQALQHNARAITSQAITEALTSSYNEEIKNCWAKIEELYSKITEDKEERKIQIAKDKLQEQEMINLHQNLEKIRKAYEENLVQNRLLREKIGELRRENKDSQIKLLDERATRAKHQATCRFQIVEMEKNYERMQTATIGLEREVEKLEFKCKLDDSKINRLELQLKKLEERIEQKDLVIEQLIRNKHRKRGFLSCF